MKGISFRAQSKPNTQGLVHRFCQYSSIPAAQRGRPGNFPRKGTIGQVNHGTEPKTLRLKQRPILLSPLTYSLSTLRTYSSGKSDPSIPVDLETALQKVDQEAAAIRHSNSVPSNESIFQILQECEEIASIFLSRERDGGNSIGKGNPTSSLLDLEDENGSASSFGEKTATTKRLRSTKSTAAAAAKNKNSGIKSQFLNRLSLIASGLLKDEKVFISPEALACYTKIETMLKRADRIPEIFRLYANKSIPMEESSPPKYSKPNPKGVSSAVPTEVANMALDVAIEQRNLPLVLDIIDNSFCTPAFQRAKLFKRAAIPLGVLAASPVASYGIASWVASVQNTMDQSTATNVTLAAILVYISATTSTGLLSIVTANDHMDRVVWMPGVPLRHRWLREEERAALDKVAVAWGFKDPNLRGEEEGEEWDDLHECIGMRGMILDKTDLMAGMQ